MSAETPPRAPWGVHTVGRFVVRVVPADETRPDPLLVIYDPELPGHPRFGDPFAPAFGRRLGSLRPRDVERLIPSWPTFLSGGREMSTGELRTLVALARRAAAAVR